jgi:hypothetical protein
VSLFLAHNALAGAIPAELGGLANLRELVLTSNELTGRLPDSFLNLSLSRFHWYDNAGLCAPGTVAFRAWLAGISNHFSGPFCSGGSAGVAMSLSERAVRPGPG